MDSIYTGPLSGSYHFRYTVLILPGTLNIFQNGIMSHFMWHCSFDPIVTLSPTPWKYLQMNQAPLSLWGQLLPGWGSGGQPAPRCWGQANVWGTDDRRPLNPVLLDGLRENTLCRLGQKCERGSPFQTSSQWPEKSGKKDNYKMNNNLESSLSR